MEEEIEVGEFSDIECESTDSDFIDELEPGSEQDASESLEEEEDDDSVRYCLPPGYVYDPITVTLRRPATETEDEDVIFINEATTRVKILDLLQDSVPSDDEEAITWGKFTRYPLSNLTPPDFTVTGSAGELPNDASPLETLQSFVGDEMMGEICHQTNNYAKVDNGKQTFEEVTVPELWCFFAIKVLMGIIKKPNIKMYFSTNPMIATNYFNTVFARNRYEEILRFFHLADNSQVDKTDRTSKFGNILKYLMDSFQNNAVPSDSLCLDESLVKYSGRLAFKQFIRTKRSRFGIKIFTLSDSKENYVLDTLIYTGKTTKLKFDKTKFGLAGAVVLSLVEPYTKFGRHLYIDNWFSSVTLSMELLKLGTHTCGTTRRNRKHLPKFSSGPNRMDKGEYEYYFSGSILCERWQDRKEVIILSTFSQPGLKAIKNRHGKVEKKPESIIKYNKYMGSTDFIDKQLKPYEIIRKTYKWYKKIFFWYLDLAIWNSYVVYKRLRRENEKVTFMDYKLALVDNIVTKFGTKRKSVGRPALREIPESIRKTGQHWPEPTPGKKKLACVLCKSKNVRHRTVIQCDKCKKPLCKFCFKEYHVT